jgi:hypothetical protein
MGIMNRMEVAIIIGIFILKILVEDIVDFMYFELKIRLNMIFR